MMNYKKRPNLHKDDNGAMMIMGVFMAVFLVGMLYYIVGLGDSIAFRERMQDTTDAGVYTAAAVNARGMNLIVLLNLVMAVIMAVLLTLKVLEVLITAALVIAAAIGALCFGCTAPAVAVLNTLRQGVRTAANAFERIAKPLIYGCHVAQEGVRLGWPVMGQARAVYAMVGDHSVTASPSAAGVTFPIYAALPTEDHIFYETCLRGSIIAVDLISAPFGSIPIIGGRVQSMVRGASKALYLSYAYYYCNGSESGDSRPPPADGLETKRVFPRTTESRQCDARCSGTDSSSCGPSPFVCESDPGGDDCGNRTAQVCFEASQQRNVLGPAYCHTPNPRARTTAEACIGDPHHWQGCNDPERATPGHPMDRQVLSNPGPPAIITRTRLSHADAVTACHRNVTQATAECKPGGASGRATNILSGEENMFVIYRQSNTLGDGACTFEAMVVPQEWLTTGQREFVNNDSGNRSSRVVGCDDHGWGPISSDAHHPFETACNYPNIPNWRTTMPPGAGHDETPDQVCRNLPPMTHNWRTQIASRINSASYGHFTVRRRITTEVYSCVRPVTLPLDVESGPTAGPTNCSASSFCPPQRVCANSGRGAFFETDCPSSGDAIHHGAPDFQIYGVNIARAQARTLSHAPAGTRLATWNGQGIGPRGSRFNNAPPASSIGFYSTAQVAGMVSLAQSEFFWDQTEGWEHNQHANELEWMWDMSWRARLRRIDFTRRSDLASASSGGVGSRVTEYLNSVFAH